MIIPGNVSDISSMVASAMATMRHVKSGEDKGSNA